MRHSALEFAERSATLGDVEPFDLVWCSSMVNLAEFFGTCPRRLRQVPGVVYFHENQLVYPSRHTEPRDVHFAFTHWAAMSAASELWFNSNYNRSSLYDGLAALLRKMPDYDAFDRARFEAISYCLPPGIASSFVPRPRRAVGPLRITWAARFEHDKGPELLLDALRLLRSSHCEFRLTIMGEQFGAVPLAFTQLASEFSDQLDHFGFEPDRAAYVRRLQETDVFISTAQHEFFGLSVMEAASCGCTLLLPHHLSYPELFPSASNLSESPFYDNTARGLSAALLRVATLPSEARPRFTEVALQYTWPTRVEALDSAVDRCVVRQGTNNDSPVY